MRRVVGVRRVVVAVLAAVAVLSGAGLAAPVAARAAGQPPSGGQATLPGLGGTPPAAPATTTAAAPAPTSTSGSAGGGGGLSSGTALGIAIAAFLIIIGIGFAIFRDARRRIPKRGAQTEERVPGSKRPPKARKLSAAEKRRRKRGRAPRRR